MSVQKTIFLCAGGTGGHVFPAFALATYFKAQGHHVIWVRDQRGARFADKWRGDEVVEIDCAPFRPKGLLKIIKGCLQSFRLLRHFKPDVVIGFGGYPSFPTVFSAQLKGIKTIIHEQNAVLGMANAVLARRADTLALGFENTKGAQKFDNTLYVGNPVRGDIQNVREKHSYKPPKDGETIKIFCVGGSLGARVFAERLPAALTALPKNIKSRLQVVQQCRAEDQKEIEDIYASGGVAAHVAPFFDNMADLYIESHLVITRAGGSTVSEILHAGRPAIFVPYPYHKDKQQCLNAQNLSDYGAAWLIEEEDFNIESIVSLIKNSVIEQQKLQAVADNLLTMPAPETCSIIGRSLW